MDERIYKAEGTAIVEENIVVGGADIGDGKKVVAEEVAVFVKKAGAARRAALVVTKVSLGICRVGRDRAVLPRLRLPRSVRVPKLSGHAVKLAGVQRIALLQALGRG